MKEIGRNIESFRKKAGLKQDALAKMAGMGRTTLYRYESGQQDMSIEKLMNIAKCLKIPLYKIIGENILLN